MTLIYNRQTFRFYGEMAQRSSTVKITCILSDEIHV